jgi:DNA transformation protein
MSRRSEFVEFIAEQMSFVGGLRVRAMFGGYGVYRDDRIFAIIVDDKPYFKADSVTRAEFEEKGLSPFTYVARGKSVTRCPGRFALRRSLTLNIRQHKERPAESTRDAI